MDTRPSDAFCAFSARLGRDPLRVQGPGGNTSVKSGAVMWIKASGTELADARDRPIFVAVDRAAARAEAEGAGAGDGSCRSAVLDGGPGLRPSIETTFHALLDWPVVAHTHSVAALVHAVCPQGREAARSKLDGLPAAFVPYAKPGLPLTAQIMARARPDTRVFILENHGLICCGKDVAETAALMEAVEERLAMAPLHGPGAAPPTPPPAGFDWAVEEGWLALDARARRFVRAGSYYPDHVVFLGPALPLIDGAARPPAILVPDRGVLIRREATAAQRAMLRCLSDLLSRLPRGWTPVPIGARAEAELLDWDAEKHRQALAARP